MKKWSGKGRIIGVGLIVGLLAAGTYAFTNTNTVDESFAGQGSDAITGFVVSGVQYTSSSTNPHKLQSVQFDLDKSARVVKVSVIDADDVALTGASGQTWYSCTESLLVAKRWSCDTGTTDLNRPAMSATNELDVVAHQ
ncbi:MAG: hypothetical protein M3161_00725 [Actinomycetota bacterium]|nr:hypothetical protein [Actinomycetota bacterium]